MVDANDVNRFLSQFQLICRKCGSDNVVMAFKEPDFTSDVTVTRDEIVAGCNACRQNDYSSEIY